MGVNLQVDYTEKLLVGYRWYTAKNIVPAFSLLWRGTVVHDLRVYSGLAVTKIPIGARASFTVTNTGIRVGAEVPQVAVRWLSVGNR